MTKMAPNQERHSAKQLYHFGFDGGHCDIALPTAKIAHGIDYYWLLTLGDMPVDLEIIPDMAIDLVLSPTLPDFAALYLPVEHRFAIALNGPVQYAGVCFRTSRIDQFFSSDVISTKQIEPGVSTIESLGIQDLVHAIQGVTHVEGFKPIFDRYWTDRLASIAPDEPMTRRLTHEQLLVAIQRSLGTQGIDSICSTLAVSDRQLRRLSQDMLGMTPKQIQSIFRLQAALSDLLSTERIDVDDLYYDDSHRIRELKKLTGFTPKQIRNMAEKYNSC